MQKDVAGAQASTLDAWAIDWSGHDAEGASEVAFLLTRAAKKMRVCAGIESQDTVVAEPPESKDVDQLRD